VLPYRPRKDRKESTTLIGMVIFLGSWAMMFATLFLAYAFVRARAESWPPAGVPRLPWKLPLGSTMVLAASSVAIERGRAALRRAQGEQLGPALVLALVLGAAFLSLQTYLWGALGAQGLRPETAGAYASVFYGLTGFHALHVAVGVLGLAVVTKRALRGEYSAAHHLPVRLWALYWHFVGVVWAVMFVSVFLT
jgi:cytochrome c oxidase subunit 3